MTFASLRQRYIGRAQTAFARSGGKLEQVIRSNSPVKTGNMQAKTRVIPRGPLKMQTLIDTEYASFVRLGTKPHDIRPVRKQVLRFEVAGKVIFSRHVRHPGTRSNDWYDQALNQRTRLLEDELRQIPL